MIFILKCKKFFSEETEHVEAILQWIAESFRIEKLPEAVKTDLNGSYMRHSEATRCLFWRIPPYGYFCLIPTLDKVGTLLPR